MRGSIGSGLLSNALGEAYGGFEQCKTDVIAVGGMRGVGWAIAYYDTTNGEITNHWINDHEDGHIAGSTDRRPRRLGARLP
jgi:Fe-Mn family superoxide dismutase